MKKFLDHMEEYLIAAFIIVMALLTTLNAVFNIAGLDIVGVPEELARFAYVYVCFLSIAYCAKTGTDVAVRMISDKYGAAAQKVLVPVRYVFDILLALVLLYGSLRYEASTAAQGRVGEATGIPLVIIYAAPIIGYTLCLVRNIRALIASRKPADA